MSAEVSESVHALERARRVLNVRLAGQQRYIAIEDAARYRDALDIPLPPGLADVWLQPARNPLLELVRRYARTHGPFTTADVAARFGIDAGAVEPQLRALHGQGRLLEGEFRPAGTHREWCDPDVLASIRRRTLARLRKEIEPVDQRVFARLVTRWQGVLAPRKGLDALLDAIETLQGAAIPASDLEREILPARVKDYRPEDLDTLMSAGEVVWVGVERVGDRDGRVALYLTQNLPALLPPRSEESVLSGRARSLLDFLQQQGASFFAPLHAAIGGGFPGDTLEALWELVWAGLVTNDTLQPLRTYLRPEGDRKQRPTVADGRPGSPEFLCRFRSRTGDGSSSQGRWSLVISRMVAVAQPPSAVTGAPPITATEWSANLAQQLLVRYGVVMRETTVAENIPGGYSTVYPALRTMEESGWIRRGMFIAAMGAAQFAMTSAVDLLRSLRTLPDAPEAVHLAAADPANAYGSMLPWPRESEDPMGTEPALSSPKGALAHPADAPASADDGRPSEPGSRQSHGMARAAGASVVLVDGALAAFLRRNNPNLRVFLPEAEPDRSRVARALARTLAEVAIRRQSKRHGLMISEINALPAREHFLAPFLQESGFVETALGFQMKRVARPPEVEEAADVEADNDSAS